MSTETQIQIFDDSMKWFPNKATDLPYNALALAGEVGEFCNILKKCERGDVEFTPEIRLDMAKELADIFIYLSLCATILDVDLERIYHVKREENCQRWGTPPLRTGNNGTTPKAE